MIWVQGSLASEGGYKTRPYRKPFFVGAGLVVALASRTNETQAKTEVNT